MKWSGFEMTKHHKAEASVGLDGKKSEEAVSLFTCQQEELRCKKPLNALLSENAFRDFLKVVKMLPNLLREGRQQPLPITYFSDFTSTVFWLVYSATYALALQSLSIFAPAPRMKNKVSSTTGRDMSLSCRSGLNRRRNRNLF
ncbi:hypothetical protein [Thiomicrorhabdus sp.]|uniref:hypothetical protein n=1 Tax=Thiomicrorhabdus sp. TaxID=2039724 RepID=UPI0029C92D21|nr:hypothetical protein [Thiomicrorhabdus sp.]